MLKKRIIANLVVKNGVVVQSIGFRKYLPVGKPEIAIEFLNQWGIDEIIMTDISASALRRGPEFKMIRNATIKCFAPLTIGGGITHVDYIKELMQCGADKIALNQAALYQTNLITEAAHVFGNQCVVISIDGIATDNGYRVYDYLNKKATDYEPGSFAHANQQAGAGEILINSVDRDGSYLGYDLALINDVCSKVNIPVIACGGAKNASDMIEVLKVTNASAASAGNFFHFTEHSVNTTKALLKKELEVRIETHADYAESMFDINMRILKKQDEILEHMMYVHIEKEII
jgi:cyclase